jgi:hypothetical protein
MARYKGREVFDPTITQKIKNALYEAGREDLVNALMDSGLRELEENFDRLQKRVLGLEQERAKFQTESGVHRIIDENRLKQLGKSAVDWSRWLVRAIGVALVGAAGAAVGHLWK